MILTTGSELYVGYMFRHHITHLHHRYTGVCALLGYMVICFTKKRLSIKILLNGVDSEGKVVPLQ